MKTFERRKFLCGAVALFAGRHSAAANAHAAAIPTVETAGPDGKKKFDPSFIYASTEDNGIELPAIRFGKLKQQYYRQIVPAPSDALAYTIVIRLAEHCLYYIQNDGTALRYGIGVGRAGFSWAGQGVIDHQKAWPSWTPPTEMVERLPDLAIYRNGMPGGLGNPLGARAFYIYRDGADTLYRIHGTPEWWSIGKSMSSGCIRMINQDIIHLSQFVTDGTRILVS